MPPLHTHMQQSGPILDGIYKVVTAQEASQWDPAHCLVHVEDEREIEDSHGSWRGYLLSTALRRPTLVPVLHSPQTMEVVRPGDVVRARAGSSLVSVLFRRGANANALFVTERCNSYCLMCSQPPRVEDDSWRLPEIETLIGLIDRDLPVLGVTGGEPTLLGDQLVEIIDRCATTLPRTQLHILTNGRRFQEQHLVERLSAVGRNVTWAVPLYADAAAVHDYVVQAVGAFEATLDGLYNLAEREQRVELRIVLHRQTISRLPALAQFVARTLPFVQHIALMGLEPMGFAKLNRDLLWMDPVDYGDILADACDSLALQGHAVSIFNLPLCVIPPRARVYARKSISDWKNSYAPSCETCAARPSCAGFFASAGQEWRSRAVRPIGRPEHDSASPLG